MPREMNAQVRFLTPEDVAEMVELSVKSVTRAIAAGDLEASQLTRRGGWRIRPAAVERWMEARSNARVRRKMRPAAAIARGGRGRLVVTEGMGRSAR